MTTSPSPRSARARRRRRHAGCLLSLLALLAAGAVSSADADDSLHKRSRDAAQQVRGARRDYDAASRLYLRTEASLQRARDRLDAARTSLVQSRVEVAAARAAHRRAQRDLLVANQRVEAVTRQLARSRTRIAQVQLAWKREVIAEYESGGTDLQALATVFQGTSPSGLMDRLAGLDAVTAAHDLTLSRTEASMALQQALEKELADARAEVRVRVAEAADELRRMQTAVAAAEATRDQVVVLVGQKREAEQKAAAVRARDAAQLRALEAEQNRIEQMLRRRAAAEADSPRRPADGFPWPVRGWISTSFGWRIHPIYGYRSYHNGIDIAAACGTPVRTPVAGTVLRAYFQTAYGNRVLIDHGALGGVGTATEYNHLDRWVVSPGQQVAPGQVIGYVGNTGWSTGCHLHFTVYRAGTPVDPLTLLD